MSYSLVHDTTDLRLCRRHRDTRVRIEPGGPVRLSDRHDDLRPGSRVERVHRALAAGHAGGARHRHERQRRQALGGLQQLRGRSGARVARRLRHGSERRASAAPGVARARPARLRRHCRLAVLPQRADQDARRHARSGRRVSTTTGSGRAFRPATIHRRARRRSKAATR